MRERERRTQCMMAGKLRLVGAAFSCRCTSAGRRYGALPGRQLTHGRVRQGPSESNCHVMPSRPVSEERAEPPLASPSVPIPHQNTQACLYAAAMHATSPPAPLAKFPTDTSLRKFFACSWHRGGGGAEAEPGSQSQPRSSNNAMHHGRQHPVSAAPLSPRATSVVAKEQRASRQRITHLTMPSWRWGAGIRLLGDQLTNRARGF